jgi:two-component system KDP operon response regulator KdpE
LVTATKTAARVLVVEDNDQLRRDLVTYLSDRGCAVEAVRTVGSALEVASKHLPHVIVTELLLPDVRTYRFAEDYRRVVPHPLVIVAVTWMPEMIFDNARRAGFDEVFGKPMDHDMLYARIERALAERTVLGAGAAPEAEHEKHRRDGEPD